MKVFGESVFKDVITLNEAMRIGPNPIWRGGNLDTQRDTRSMHSFLQDCEKIKFYGLSHSGCVFFMAALEN